MNNKLPGEELIDTLDDARLLLNSLRERLEQSGVERTKGIREALGEDCKWYRKSLSMFLDKDYVELRDLIQTAHSLFQQVEGK